MKNNYETLTEEEVRAYLLRLNLDPSMDLTPSKELLDILLKAHHLTVPFEDIWVYEGKLPLSIEVKDLFDKIVNKRRGGYCFELNGLFVTLLRTLGFNAYSCFCRVMIMGDAIRPIAHRGNIIEVDGKKYFGAVGFGGAMPDGGLLLEDGSLQQIDKELYKAIYEEGGWWTIMRKKQGKDDDYVEDADESFTHVIMFNEAMADPVDFYALNASVSMNEMAPFRRVFMCNLRTEEGYRSINDLVLKEKKNVS